MSRVFSIRRQTWEVWRDDTGCTCVCARVAGPLSHPKHTQLPFNGWYDGIALVFRSTLEVEGNSFGFFVLVGQHRLEPSARDRNRRQSQTELPNS